MKGFTKRMFGLMLVMVMLFSLTACFGEGDATSEDVNTDQETASEDGDGSSGDVTSSIDVDEEQKEAPMLAELVAKGDLPALEERLPIASDVMIENVVSELGQYGGSLLMTETDSGHWTWGPYTEQSLFRFKQDGTGQVEANICKDYYSNDDATVWTIELREGMKWSDGQPLTADDFEFYYNHMSVPALNADRSPIGADEEGYYNAFTTKPYRAYYVMVDGVNYWAEFVKVDDYTIQYKFAAPKPGFPEAVAIDNKWAVAPKHFYKDIVSRKDGVTDDSTFPYITEEEALAKANEILDKDFESYSTMGKKTGYYNWDYYQVPQLRSFIATDNNWDKVGETYTLVRNPYFFKTDELGRQLPYLDKIEIQIINEQEQHVLKATAGEFDVYAIKPEVFSTVASSTKDSHRVSSWTSVNWGREYVICLNQTVEDENLRILFQSKDFRQALSIAVDRELLNATLANGQAAPWQFSPGLGMNGYDADWAKKWTDYDVAKANELLDGLTEPWDGTPGTYRKMKGTEEDLVLNFSLNESQADRTGDYFGLLTSAYAELGIKVLTKVQADVAQIILANEHQVTIDYPYGVSPAIRPDTIVPMRNYMGWYGAYGKWYEDNRSTENGGVEPSGDMLALVDAYDAIATAAGANRTEIISENVQKIYDLHHENIWIIGFLSPISDRFLVSNDLKNFPDGVVNADEFRWASMMRPEQLFKVQED